MQDSCARSGWASLGREEVHPLNARVNVMKSPLKVIKRVDRDVTLDKEISSARTSRRMIALIGKGWITESRKLRRANFKRVAEKMK